jgi:ABC-type transport system involved in multi-copper enzyme maturation permease subunit
VIGGTGAFSLFVGCMIAASFIGSEQSCGYTKNFAGQLPNRGYMAVSKFAVTSVAQVIVLVIYAAVSAALVPVFFGKYVTGYSIAALLEALGLRLMLHIAVNAIIVFICTLTKSHAIAMVLGSIFGLGITQIAYWAASMVLRIAKINFDIGQYMPDGLNGQISIASIGSIYIKAIIVSVAFTAVFLIANYIVVSKRDVK